MNINHHLRDLWPFLAWLPLTFPLRFWDASPFLSVTAPYRLFPHFLSPVNLSFSPPCLMFQNQPMSASLISNLFQVSICLICFPRSSLTPSYTMLSAPPASAPTSLCDMTDHFTLHFFLSTISLLMFPSLPLSIPSRRLLSLCLLSVVSTNQKRDYYSLVIFRGASKRRRRGR